MAHKMKKYIVGPMLAQQFLDEIFPKNSIDDLGVVGEYNPGCYDDTVTR